MRDVPGPLTISDDTFRHVLMAMAIGISELEEKRPAAWSSALAEALISALEGNREAVLVQVADVLAPPLPGLDLDKESHG